MTLVECDGAKPRPITALGPSGNGVLACCHFLLSPHASYRGQLSCRRPQTTHMHGPERIRTPPHHCDAPSRYGVPRIVVGTRF